MSLRDDAPIEWELVDPTEPGLTVDEAYALLAGLDRTTSTTPMPQVADGNPRPGAKVADTGTGR